MDKFKDYLDLLSEHPDYTYKQLSNRLEISELELQSYSNRLKVDDSAWRYIMRTTYYPEFLSTFVNIISKDREWLEYYINDKFVFPKILEIHPGPFCTHNCKHCFSKNIEYEEYDELMKFEDLTDVLRTCKEGGTEELWISGGKEPFTANYTSDLIQFAADIGLRVRLYTNGLLMQGERLEAALRCYQIRISLNAIKPETYAIVNGVSCFDVVMQNLEKLLSNRLSEDHDINVIGCMIVQPDNHNEIFEFVDNLTKLGLDMIQLRKDSVGRTGRLLTFENKRIIEQIDRIKKECYSNVDIRGLSRKELESKNQFYPGLGTPNVCYAGAYKRSINPFGDVYYCDFCSHPVFSNERINLCIGNIKDEKIEQIFIRAFREQVSTCDLCQQHGYGLNLQIYKLKEDIDFGVGIGDQPFNREGCNE